MYVHNHAVKEYREGMKEGLPDKQAAPCLKGSLPVPAEPETGSFCERAAALLERFIDTAGDEARNAPNDQPAKEREKILVYLAKLNRREGEAAGARHRGELAELARLMETGYLEFWIRDAGAENVTVEVFDRVLFRCRAELTFRKIPFQPHYVLVVHQSSNQSKFGYRFLSLPENAAHEAKTFFDYLIKKYGL